MRNYRFFRALKFIVCVAAAIFVFGYVTMHLWNWLVPAIFGLRTITYTQAIGLLLLSKILLGGFHRHGGRGRGGRGRGGRNGGHRGWKRHMEERFSHMTPEERERFRAGMRGRRNCGFGRQDVPTSEQTPV